MAGEADQRRTLRANAAVLGGLYRAAGMWLELGAQLGCLDRDTAGAGLPVARTRLHAYDLWGIE
jgi:hypothetical protein